MLQRSAITISLALLLALGAFSPLAAQTTQPDQTSQPSQTGQPDQTAQPITTLPRPAGDTAPIPTPPLPQQQQQPQPQPPQQQLAPTYPADSVHPITSLPKPPQAPPSVNLRAIEPPEAEPVVVAPANVPAPPPQPQAPPAEPYKIAPTTTPPPPPPPPQPVPTIPAPLHASMNPTPTAPPPPPVVRNNKVHLFSTFGVAFKFGLAGIGVDVATPLAQHFNLRGGGSIFSYAGSYNDSGDVYAGNAQFRSGHVDLDYFPFHSGFRVSAGVFINGTRINVTNTVAPGTEFDISDGTYYSSATDPVHGTTTFNLGREFAPSFTVGWGNIIPRGNKHISFPFEIGFAYTGAPTIHVTLLGSVCDASTPPNCQSIDNDPDAQADLVQQENNINADIRFLRFFPILSQGISFKF